MSVPVVALWVLSFAFAWRAGAENHRNPVLAAMWAAGNAAVIALMAAIEAMGTNWFVVPVYVAGAVIWAWIAWQNWRRRRKKRSLRALGHKARARLAAMARNMPRPGPVLRPVPQGARA